MTSAPPAAAGGASIGSDQTQVSQLEQEIASEGVLVEQLVSRYDEAQANVATLEAALASDDAQLAQDRQAENRARAQLRSLALSTYMNDSGLDSALALFSGDGTSSSLRAEYAEVASGNIATVIDTVRLDQARTSVAQAAAQRDEAQARAALVALGADRQAAQEALERDQATLAQVKGNLAALLAEAQQQRLAAEQAAEQAMAAPPPLAPPSASAPDPPPVVTPSPGGYVNPLRGIGALQPERIDQGVDYSGYGPIYAIGDGVVLSTVNAGWPGGTFISYRLTDGRANGLVVYAAEDIDPVVNVGERVTSNTVLGQMYEGPNGIETGWADSSGQGSTMAHDYGQYNGSNSTAFGYNFSRLLQSLGAPGGALQNDPPTGTLPPGWPTW